MDYWKALKALHEEKAKLDGAIATIESLMNGGNSLLSRRGRKSMPADERREVSERMRRYWATHGRQKPTA